MFEDILLFVYGSLLSGLKHHEQMRGARLLGMSSLTDYHLVLYKEAYPALVPGTTADPAHFARVAGELYVVSPQHLSRLDVFEECPTLYQRKSVRLTSGDVAQAYTITPTQAHGYPVILGDFRAHLATQPADEPKS